MGLKPYLGVIQTPKLDPMKKINLLLLCLCATITTIYAQTPLSDFYQNGTSWTWYQYTDHAHGSNTQNVYAEYIAQDTTVGSKVYKTLWQYQKGRVSVVQGELKEVKRYDSSDRTLLGGIRIDGEKVYFINLSADTNSLLSLPPMSETIIYDFDLKVGDTLAWKPYKNIVLAIDSVMLSNGKYEKRYYFEDTHYDDFWVRGAGCSMGFLMSHTAQPYMQYYLPKHYAVCYNGSTGYKYYESAKLDSSIVDHCYLIFPLSVNNIVNGSKIELYPNPVTVNNFTITLSDAASSVKVYDIRGVLISAKEDAHIGANLMSAPEAAGMYIVHVLHKDGTVEYLKFQKL